MSQSGETQTPQNPSVETLTPQPLLSEYWRLSPAVSDPGKVSDWALAYAEAVHDSKTQGVPPLCKSEQKAEWLKVETETFLIACNFSPRQCVLNTGEYSLQYAKFLKRKVENFVSRVYRSPIRRTTVEVPDWVDAFLAFVYHAEVRVHGNSVMQHPGLPSFMWIDIFREPPTFRERIRNTAASFGRTALYVLNNHTMALGIFAFGFGCVLRHTLDPAAQSSLNGWVIDTIYGSNATIIPYKFNLDGTPNQAYIEWLGTQLMNDTFEPSMFSATFKDMGAQFGEGVSNQVSSLMEKMKKEIFDLKTRFSQEIRQGLYVSIFGAVLVTCALYFPTVAHIVGAAVYYYMHTNLLTPTWSKVAAAIWTGSALYSATKGYQSGEVPPDVSAAIDFSHQLGDIVSAKILGSEIVQSVDWEKKRTTWMSLVPDTRTVLTFASLILALERLYSKAAEFYVLKFRRFPDLGSQSMRNYANGVFDKMEQWLEFQKEHGTQEMVKLHIHDIQTTNDSVVTLRSYITQYHAKVAPLLLQRFGRWDGLWKDVCSEARMTQMRDEPYTISLVGPIGSGKSYVSSFLCQGVFRCRRVPITGSVRDSVWAANAASEYMDGYRQQPIVIIDDADSINPMNTSGDMGLARQMMTWNSNIPVTAKMAALEHKEMPFTSKLIIRSCNAFKHSDVAKMFTHFPAMERRWGKVVVMRFKDKYLTGKATANNTLKYMIDADTSGGMRQLNSEALAADGISADAPSMELYDFYFFDNYVGDDTGASISFDDERLRHVTSEEFLSEILEEMIKHFKKQDRHLEIFRSWMTGELLCPMSETIESVVKSIDAEESLDYDETTDCEEEEPGLITRMYKLVSNRVYGATEADPSVKVRFVQREPLQKSWTMLQNHRRSSLYACDCYARMYEQIRMATIMGKSYLPSNYETIIPVRSAKIDNSGVYDWHANDSVSDLQMRYAKDRLYETLQALNIRAAQVPAWMWDNAHFFLTPEDCFDRESNVTNFPGDRSAWLLMMENRTYEEFVSDNPDFSWPEFYNKAYPSDRWNPPDDLRSVSIDHLSASLTEGSPKESIFSFLSQYSAATKCLLGGAFCAGIGLLYRAYGRRVEYEPSGLYMKKSTPTKRQTLALKEIYEASVLCKIDPGIVAEAASLTRNYAVLSVSSDDGSVSQLRGFYVKKGILFTTGHFFTGMRPGAEVTVSHAGCVVKWKYDPKKVVHSKNDLCCFSTGSSGGEKKNVIKKFATLGALERLRPACGLYYRKKTKEGPDADCSEGFMDGASFSASKSVAVSAFSADITYSRERYSEKPEEVLVTHGISYQCPLEKGDCGVPIFGTTSEGSILGFHVANGKGSGVGICAFMPREIVEAMVNTLESESFEGSIATYYQPWADELLSESSDEYQLAKMGIRPEEYEYVGFHGLVGKALPFVGTRLEPTVDAGVHFPVEKIPAKQTSQDIAYNLRALDIPCRALADDLRSDLVAFHRIGLRAILGSDLEQYACRILTLEETILGCPVGPFNLDPMNLDSSAGHGFPGKKSRYIRFLKDGTLWVDPRVRSEFEDRIAAACRGESSQVMVKLTLKDECLKISKAEAHRGRIFAVPNIVDCLVKRAVTGCSHVLELELASYACANANPYSTDWSEIGHVFASRCARFLGYDTWRFDKRLQSDLKLDSRAGWTHVDSDWSRAYATVVHDETFPTIVLGGVVISAAAYHHFSGVFGTTLEGCSVSNSIVYTGIKQALGLPKEIGGFEYHITPALAAVLLEVGTCGDDLVCGLTHQFMRSFPMNASQVEQFVRNFASELEKELSIVVTNENKDGPPVIVDSLTDVSFCSREFVSPAVSQDGHWYAPLKMESILNSFNWKVKHLTDLEARQNAVSDAYMELSQHAMGGRDCQELLDSVNNAARAFGLHPVLFTNQDLKDYARLLKVGSGKSFLRYRAALVTREDFEPSSLIMTLKSDVFEPSGRPSRTPDRTSQDVIRRILNYSRCFSMVEFSDEAGRQEIEEFNSYVLMLEEGSRFGVYELSWDALSEMKSWRETLYPEFKRAWAALDNSWPDLDEREAMQEPDPEFEQDPVKVFTTALDVTPDNLAEWLGEMRTTVAGVKIFEPSMMSTPAATTPEDESAFVTEDQEVAEPVEINSAGSAIAVAPSDPGPDLLLESLSRWSIVHTLNWATTDPVGPLGSNVQLLHALLSATPLYENRLDFNYLLTFDSIELKVMFNANPFSSGRLWTIFGPLGQLDSTALNESIFSSSAFPGIMVNPCNSATTSLVCPFVSPQTAIDTFRASTTLDEIGTLQPIVVVPLQSSAATTFTVTFMARMLNPRVNIPYCGGTPFYRSRGTPVQRATRRSKVQSLIRNVRATSETEAINKLESFLAHDEFSGSMKSSLSKEAAEVRAKGSDFAPKAGGVLEGAAAGAAVGTIVPGVGTGVGAMIGGTLGFLGLAKPSASGDASRVEVNDPFPNMMNVTGQSDTVPLTHDPIHTSILPKPDLFGGDEPTLENLGKKPLLIFNSTWTTAEAINTLKFTIPVNPTNCFRETIATNEHIHAGPFQRAASMAAAWRADCKVHVDVVVDGFQQGRLALGYEPARTATLNNTCIPTNAGVIIDVRNGRGEAELSIPYVQPTPTLMVPVIGNNTYQEASCNGTFSCWVVNPLNPGSNSGNTSAVILVYISWYNIHLYGWNLDFMRFLVPSAGVELEDQEEDAFIDRIKTLALKDDYAGSMMATPTPTDGTVGADTGLSFTRVLHPPPEQNIAEVVYGAELPQNLKSWLKRYWFIAIPEATGSGSISLASDAAAHNSHNFRMHLPTDFTPFNDMYDPISWILECFRAQRGGIRYRLYPHMPVSSTSEGTTINNMRVNYMYDDTLTRTNMFAWTGSVEGTGSGAIAGELTEFTGNGVVYTRISDDFSGAIEVPPMYNTTLERTLIVRNPSTAVRAQAATRPLVQVDIVSTATRNSATATGSIHILEPHIYIYRAVSDDFEFGYRVGPPRFQMTTTNFNDVLSHTAGSRY